MDSKNGPIYLSLAVRWAIGETMLKLATIALCLTLLVVPGASAATLSSDSSGDDGGSEIYCAPGYTYKACAAAAGVVLRACQRLGIVCH